MPSSTQAEAEAGIGAVLSLDIYFGYGLSLANSSKGIKMTQHNLKVFNSIQKYSKVIKSNQKYSKVFKSIQK